MKNTSKILALVLVLVMSFAVISAFSFTTSAAGTSVRVYCDNQANYSGTIYCYYWGGSNGPTWPGKAMSKDAATGYWYYDIPAGHNMVIFTNKNAGSWQTGNLNVPTTDAVVFNNKTNTWSQYIPPQAGHKCNWVEDKDQYVAPTCTETGKKVYNCAAEGCSTKTKSTTLSALGHNYSGTTCTRCSAVAVFTVAGNGAHIGTEWDPGNAANDMTYADGVYTKVYTNVAAGSYGLKCVRDHSWDVGYGGIGATADKDGNYKYTVATSGSTVTVTLKGTTVTVTVEAPHICNFVAGEVVPPTYTTEGYTVYTCSCGKTENRDIVPALVAVAQVGEVKFADLQEAIKAAAPAGTVELLCDVTVDEWIMIAERLTIADGTIITLDMNGLTIDGNGHTLTVNSIESAGNGGYLFHGASNLNVQDLTIKVAEGFVGGISLKSGNIINVTFEGGTRAVMPGEGEVKIEGCTFKTNGHAVYYEEARNNLVVNNNTFELADNANVIILRGTEQFTNNTVISGRTVNVVSGSPVVTGNNFGDVRLKVYNEATATISNNTINNLVFNDETVAGSVFADNTLSESAEAALNAVLPHTHSWSDPTCTEPAKCECGETQGEALGHTWNQTTFVCDTCGIVYCVVAGQHTFVEHYPCCAIPACSTPHPDYKSNYATVGTTTLVCNQWNLVADGEGQHGKPYQFTFITIPEDGYYLFTSTSNLGITIYTIPYDVNDPNWVTGGPNWSAWTVGGAELKAGIYYVGYIFNNGEGEYDVTITKHDHTEEVVAGKDATCTEAGLTEGKKCSVCGTVLVKQEEIPATGHTFVDGKCECGADEPVVEPPVEEPTEEPKEELNWFQKIIAWFMELINKLLALFKK